jgi:exodeoxyribonuclease VII small subunit
MKRKTSKVKPEPSFEDALAQLEILVEKLEDGDIPLEESVDAYVRGMELVKHCMKKLDKAESTLKKLTQTGEDIELIDEPMGEDDDLNHA